MAILDANGKPFEQDVLHDHQTSSLIYLQRQIAEHPAKGITPARLNEILQQAELGQLMYQHELFEDMEERDGHVFSELAKRKRATMKLDWSIVAPRDATVQEQKDAEWVDDILRDMADFEDTLYDLLDAISHGFSALEIEWRRIGGTWVMAKLHHRPQSWFQMDWETRTKLRLRDATADGQELKPFGWVMHTHRAKSGYLARSGLARILVWPYLFKHYSVGDLAEFLDICGIPLRLGKYPGNATKEEKATLWRAVAGMSHAAAGIIPNSMSVDFQQAAQGSEKPFETMIRWCEHTQTKAITGSLPFNERGTGGGIGNGLADLANEVRKEIRDSDAKQLAGTITQQLIYPLLAINKGWADPRRCPRLVFDVAEGEDIKAYADALPKLVAIGMRIPATWAHDRLRIPVADDRQEVLSTVPTGTNASHSKSSDPVPVKLTALVAALRTAHQTAPAQHDYADQAAIDAAMREAAKGMQPQVEQWLAPAITALRSTGNAEDALQKLAENNPLTNDEVLIEAIARVMFVCELVGWDSVQGELRADT